MMHRTGCVPAARPIVTPTRRAFLGGGLAAAAWGLGARAETPAPAADGFLPFEAAPSRLALRPAAGRTGVDARLTPARRRARFFASRRARS